MCGCRVVHISSLEEPQEKSGKAVRLKDPTHTFAQLTAELLWVQIQRAANLRKRWISLANFNSEECAPGASKFLTTPILRMKVVRNLSPGTHGKEDGGEREEVYFCFF